MTKPIAPFMHQKGEPPLHLRTWSPEEFDVYERMLAAHRKVHKQAAPKPELSHPSRNPGTPSQ